MDPFDGETIQIWSVELAADEDALAYAEGLLSTDEIDRANHFRFAHLRRSYVFARGVLRTLIAAYLQTRPEDLRFAYGPEGKPSLIGLATAFRFNVSHSGRFGAYAFTSGSEIGVDIEQVRPMPDWRDLAQRFFSAEEIAYLMAAPQHLGTAAFFNCWVRKEAYVKAVGRGLSIPLNSFFVPLDSDDAVRMHGGDAGYWTVHAFNPAAGYVGAVVCGNELRKQIDHRSLTAQQLLLDKTFLSQT